MAYIQSQDTGRALHLGKRSSFAPLGRQLEDLVKMHPRALSRQKSYAGRKLMALMVIPYFASVAGLVEWDCPCHFHIVEQVKKTNWWIPLASFPALSSVACLWEKQSVITFLNRERSRIAQV